MRRGCSNWLANAAAAGAACRRPPGSVGSLQRQPQGPRSENAPQKSPSGQGRVRTAHQCPGLPPVGRWLGRLPAPAAQAQALLWQAVQRFPNRSKLPSAPQRPPPPFLYLERVLVVSPCHPLPVHACQQQQWDRARANQTGCWAVSNPRHEWISGHYDVSAAHGWVAKGPKLCGGSWQEQVRLAAKRDGRQAVMLAVRTQCDAACGWQGAAALLQRG